MTSLRTGRWTLETCRPDIYSPSMTHRERVQAVLAGRQPDHAPVSFWHHFAPHQTTGQSAVDAHLRFLETYDLDFLKVMNDHPYPRGRLETLRTPEDLRKLEPLAGHAEGFADQLEIISQLRQSLGRDVLICTTLFNSWTVLRQFTAPPTDRHLPPRLDGSDARDDLLSELLKSDRSAFKAALAAMTQTLAAFARACLDAGADGIFLSVRDDWVDRPANGPGTYAELVRPLDLEILAGTAGATFNILHTCGRPVNFDAFARYPVQAINWADRAAGPSIATARDILDRARSASEGTPAIAGGVDNLNTLPRATAQACADEVRDALHQAAGRPMIISAGCTFDPEAVPPANLQAVVAAARGQ